MVKSANPMIRMRPAGPKARRASSAFRGMRTFTSLFCAVFGTKSNSLMVRQLVRANRQPNLRTATNSRFWNWMAVPCFGCRSNFLSAAGAGIEVQAYGIARQIHGHKVAHVNAQSIRRVNDVHVVRRYRKIEAAGFIQDSGAQ